MSVHLSGADADAVLHVGPYVLEPAGRQLLAEGRPLAIGSRAFALLHLLARQQGRALRAGQLLQAVWPGQPVNASNLRVQVAALRKLLGAQAIATSKADGYRLTLDVRLATAPTRAALPGNLPEHVADIHGRDAERQQLAALLTGHARVTLAGPAGVGKTTLARTCAHDLWSRYADGVWWVELAALQTSALLCETVAATLQLPLRSGLSVDTLARALAQRRLLLVLDNCEHLADAVTALADALLGAAPQVVLLATSRRTLRNAGEQVLRLPPLSLPVGPGLAEARASGAVAWFVARAQRADPGFHLTQANVEAVVGICRQLDGVALAIGLAAARVPVLGVAGLHDRLHERLRLLVGRELDARGQPLALLAALDWSHDLLSPAEQTVLRRLAVFAGSFSLPAVQAVVNDTKALQAVGDTTARRDVSDTTLDEWAVLDALHALIDHSLLTPDAAVLQAGASARYTLHESLRLYARERLRASGEAMALQRRHAEQVLGEPRSARGPDHGQLMVITLDDADHDNLRAALDWATAHDLPLAIQLALKHAAYMRRRGHQREAEDRHAAMLAHADIAALPLLAGRLHMAQASMVFERGLLALAHRHLAAAIALQEPLGDPELHSAAVAWTSTIYMLERELDAAEAALLRAVQIQRAPGLETVLVSTLNNLGCVLLERGRYDEARQVLDEALSLSRRIPFPWGMAIAFENLGELAYMQRDWLGAMAHWLQALPGVREQRHIYHEAMVLMYQGMALRRQGQPAAAAARVQESLHLTVQQQMHQLVADGLCACAALALDAGRPRRAAVLLHAAAHQRKETAPTGPALLDLSETEPAARAALSAADWHAARAEGESFSAEQMLAQEAAERAAVR